MLSSSSATQSPCLTCGTVNVNLSKLISADTSKYGRKVSQNFRKMDLQQETAKNLINRSSHTRRIRALAASTLPVIQTVDKLSTYLFRTERGGHVKVIITRLKDGKYGVNIEVSPLRFSSNKDDVIMSWGIFRSDSSSNDSGIFETRFTDDSEKNRFVKLEFDAGLAPFYISFLLKCSLDGETIEIRSHRKTKFCFPVGLKSGNPTPLGVSYTPNGSLNFALFSRTAKNVILCLFDDSSKGKPVLEIDLDPYVNRSGDIWHASMDSRMNFSSYGYRFKNEKSREDSVLLDPYSKVIGENFLGKICKEPVFDWRGDCSPNLPIEKLLVYRLNVTDFTISNEPGGTFSDITEKLDHFKNLGVNAILLEPITPFDKKGPYYPSHFFSSQSSYGPRMKEMVKVLHANGIEILLEVVFTHTSENSSLGKIDKPTYYSSENALNSAHPVVQQLILDSLRHWVIEYHIDGFCFINASSMLLGFNRENFSRPVLIEAISFDPILSNAKIIADNSANDTQFPHWKKWAEMNGKFCIDIRNYLRGEGLVSNLATRLCGSGDIFLNGRGPGFSFNFVSTNRGFSLVDLVSFSSVTELSWNCGEEGATKRKTVLETRLKQTRNFLFILYISLGVPVLNSGDECGQSSGGKGFVNRNDRKPFDWKALQTGFASQTIQFISFLSSLKKSRFFQSNEFLKVENIDWYGPNLCPPNWEDSTSKFLAMSLKVDRADQSDRVDRDDGNPLTGDMFVAFNGGDGLVTVSLPPTRLGMGWVRLVDTGLSYPGFFSMEGEPVVEKKPGSVGYEMVAHSCVLLEARSLDG